MNQSDSGWRKRQIALEIKAENARELGLDYEPDKTIMEMAREADPKANFSEPYCFDPETRAWLERFAALVRAEEREKFLGALRQLHDSYSLQSDPSGLRARGQA
jgi:hypothetical protein